MIKAVYAFAAVGMGVTAVSTSVAGTPGQDVIQQLFDKATEVFKGKGFIPTGWQQRGELKQGAEASFTVALKGGAQVLIGMCDDNCSKLDMYVSRGGSEVGENVEEDESPIVVVNEPGTYTVRIVMKACANSPCAIGVKGYQQQ